MLASGAGRIGPADGKENQRPTFIALYPTIADARLARDVADSVGFIPEELGQHLAEDSDLWERLIRKADIKAG
jgi:hypothetical protein